MATRVRPLRAAIAGALALVLAGTAHAEQRATGGGSVPAVQRGGARGPAIRGGHDMRAAWLAAEYRDLRVEKRTIKESQTIALNLRYEDDLVSVTVSPTSLLVSRAGQSVVVDSPDALLGVQRLLGGSAAVFAARAMLSELEGDSELKAPDMSLLASAAFLASLVGDTHGPRRLAERWLAKYRGILRPIRYASNCWSTYSTESTAAWDQLQACMEDANNRGFVRAAYERLACNAVWLIRSESAWIEYLTCLSPAGAIFQ